MIIMHITKSALNKAYKPFDVVTDNYGNVGSILQIRIMSSTYNKLSYSIIWLVIVKPAHTHDFWYEHGDLKPQNINILD